MIFTIGTSNRSLSEFLWELSKRDVTQIIDLRSSPFSRAPWFNAGQIERWSAQAGIFYRREGAVLGGRSDVSVDDPSYLAALDRLLNASMN